MLLVFQPLNDPNCLKMHQAQGSQEMMTDCPGDNTYSISFFLSFFCFSVFHRLASDPAPAGGGRYLRSYFQI